MREFSSTRRLKEAEEHTLPVLDYRSQIGVAPIRHNSVSERRSGTFTTTPGMNGTCARPCGHDSVNERRSGTFGHDSICDASSLPLSGSSSLPVSSPCAWPTQSSPRVSSRATSNREFRYFLRLLTRHAVIWTEMVMDERIYFVLRTRSPTGTLGRLSGFYVTKGVCNNNEAGIDNNRAAGFIQYIREHCHSTPKGRRRQPSTRSPTQTASRSFLDKQQQQPPSISHQQYHYTTQETASGRASVTVASLYPVGATQ